MVANKKCRSDALEEEALVANPIKLISLLGSFAMLIFGSVIGVVVCAFETVLVKLVPS